MNYQKESLLTEISSLKEALLECQKSKQKLKRNLQQTKKILKQTQQAETSCLVDAYERVTGVKVQVDQSPQNYIERIHDYYNGLIAVMPGSIYWKNDRGDYLGCNNNLASILHLDNASSIIGKTDFDLMPKKQATIVSKTDQEIIQTGKAKSLEEIGFDLSGREAIYFTHKIPIYDNQNNVIGLLGISLDITQLKKTEKDLIRAKETAEAANAAKSQFVANMEHDLRTPTSGIYGLLKGWVAHEPKKAERKKFYGLLSQSAWQLLKLLDSILEFTRLESGKKPILEKKFRIRTFIDYLVELEQPAALTKHLKLSTKVAKDVPDIVKGDRFRVYRILINIVSNAIKFTQNGSINISVKLVQKAKDKDHRVFLAFEIKDTGIGIPKDEQEKVYEKFVRLDPSNRGIYKGSGLGLTVVKEFVNDLSGEIDLVSELGKGSKFTIVLPFALPILDDPDAVDWQEEKDSYEEMIWFHK